MNELLHILRSHWKTHAHPIPEYLTPIALGQALPFQHMIEGVADEPTGGTPDIGISPAKFPLNIIPEDNITAEPMLEAPWERQDPFAELRGEDQYQKIEEIDEMDLIPSAIECEDQPAKSEEIGGMDPSPSELEREDQPTKIEEIGGMDPSPAEVEGEDQTTKIQEAGEMDPSPAEVEGEDQTTKIEEIGEMYPSPAELPREDQPTTIEEIGEPEPENQNPMFGETLGDPERLRQYGLR